MGVMAMTLVFWKPVATMLQNYWKQNDIHDLYEIHRPVACQRKWMRTIAKAKHRRNRSFDYGNRASMELQRHQTPSTTMSSGFIRDQEAQEEEEEEEQQEPQDSGTMPC